MNLINGFLHLALLAGSCDPYGIKNEEKKKQFINIIKHAEYANQDPYELFAIAITESSLKPNAYSHTKDVGLFQVNCRWWYKKFNYRNIKHCEYANQDPYELLAIAITESSLKPNAYSHTKDVGLFQVNCRWWYKKFNYRNIKHCERVLKDPDLKYTERHLHLKSL